MELKTKKIIAREFIVVCVCIIVALLIALSCILFNTLTKTSDESRYEEMNNALNAPPPTEIDSIYTMFDPFWTVGYRIAVEKRPQKFNEDKFRDQNPYVEKTNFGIS
ncbi:MAG: hypothetical protein ISS19_10335 [Bacteroidales bacterium]|nr:hypothetical protein [Bacteroidales bacterium]